MVWLTYVQVKTTLEDDIHYTINEVPTAPPSFLAVNEEAKSLQQICYL
jgi:anaerobic glycerol-3-phosphate dehydrogenase